MKNASVALLFLILIFQAVPGKTQSSSRSSTDSARLAKRDSLQSTEYPKYLRPGKQYLKNDVAFGGTAGSPGGLNFVAEGYYNRLGIRIEGGFFGMPPFFLIAGYQTDLCFVLERSPNTRFECTAFYSRTFSSSIDDDGGTASSTYGIGAALSAKGFFVEIGFSPYYFKNLNAYNFFHSIFQIGYVH